MSYQEHRGAAAKSVAVAILTSSDSRRLENDDSGLTIQTLLEAHGHRVTARRVVRDESAQIRRAARALLAKDADALVVNGGTGAGPRDVTPEALRPLFVKEFPGFGEQFRALSTSEIGTGAYLSRATLGLVRAKGRLCPVFVLPGSPDACRLATERLILPELGHLVSLAQGSHRPHA